MSARWRKGRFKPGYQWRFLAHRQDVPHPIAISSEQYVAPVEFDELVVDHWLHIEQMSERHWWMRVGNYRVEITIDGDGRPDVSFEHEETSEEAAEHCEQRRLRA